MSQKKFFLIIVLFAFFTPKVYASVVINEFQIEPTVNQWVELFNKGNEVVDISSWVIDDSGGTEKFIIPDNTTIATNSFQLFESGKFNFNKSTPDQVRLFSIDNSLVDYKEYPESPGLNVTLGRYPDGGDNWGVCTPTSSANNNCVAPTPTPTMTMVPTQTFTPTTSPKPTQTPTSSPTAMIPTMTPTATPQNKSSPSVGSIINTSPKPTIEASARESASISGVKYDTEKTATFSVEFAATDSSKILGVGTASPSLKKTKIPFNYFIIAGILFLVGSLSLLYTAKQHEKNS